MKKQIITFLGFFFALIVEGQTNSIRNSFDKKKAEQLIVGQWQQTELSVTCDQIEGFNERMNNPVSRASFKSMANATSLEFDSGGKLISRVMLDSYPSRYQISDDGSVTIRSNIKNKLPQKQNILELTSDTLIFTIKRKTNTADMLDLLSALKLKKDRAKTITYTYTYYKIKEANAPWAAIENNLPKKRWVENLTYHDSTFFTIVSDPSSQNDDSIYASNNYCANWFYGGHAIPKSEEELGKIMSTEGSKVFITTRKGVFATEKRGESWTEITSLPTASSGFGLPQFGTTATRIYGGFGAKLFASGDNANTWDSLRTPLQNGDDMIMTLAANETNIIIGGLDGNRDSNGIGTFLLLSTDDGKSWKNMQVAPEDYPGIMPGHIAIAGPSVFMDTQYGMFRSDLQQINWLYVKGLSLAPLNNAFTPHEPTGSSGENNTNLLVINSKGILYNEATYFWKDILSFQLSLEKEINKQYHVYYLHLRTKNKMDH